MKKLKYILFMIVVYAILAFSVYTAFTMDGKTADALIEYYQGNQ